jgi:cell volume regulation protein A
VLTSTHVCEWFQEPFALTRSALRATRASAAHTVEALSDGHLILVGGALLAAALGASVLAARVRLPGLLILLALGMAVGVDGAGLIAFSDYEMARRIGTIALAVILFEGGLSAGLAEIRPVLGAALRLGMIGTAITALLAGVAAAFLFGVPLIYGVLLGSILASTDTAAVFGLLRGSPLKRRLGRTLEGEAGLNDPVAVLLVVGCISWIQQPAFGAGDMALLLVRQLSVGAISGVLFGWGGAAVLRRLRLDPPGLYPVASTATAALAYGAADTFGGSGFLAVYLAGLALGSKSIPGGRALRVFHGGAAWVAQLTLFLVLGLLVNPGELGSVAAESFLLAVVVVLVARPAAVMLVTVTDRFSVNERILLAWAGLRGAVPVVLATFPVIAGVPHAVRFFDIAFFTVVLSTLAQGTTFEPLARRLGLMQPRAMGRDERTRAGGPIAPLLTQLWPGGREDPADPMRVADVDVSRRLSARGDLAGALVELADGRVAVTGPAVAVGSRRQVERWAKRRLEAAEGEAEARWWRAVLAGLHEDVGAAA